MELELIYPKELAGDLVDDWDRLRAANPGLSSPFFDVKYTAAVGEVRSDVAVLRMVEDDQTVGFFPFQRDASGVGRPVGLRLTDFQGVIAAPDTAWDVNTLLRAADLKAFYFDHWVAQAPFAEFQQAEAASPWIDLSKGFDAYVEEKRNAGSRFFTQLGRKSRKMSREVAPLEFEFQDVDRGALETLIEWKSAQRRETQTVDVLDFDWVRELFARFLDGAGSDFCGVLSTLRAGDRLVAAHFGLRSGSCLHYWFPAYDREFSRYSTGGILLLEMARAAAASGIARIDLGTGDESYKSSFESGSDMLAEGCADTRLLGRVYSQLWFRARAWGRGSRVGALMKGPVTTIKRISQRRALR